MTVASLNARLLARKGDARPAPVGARDGGAQPAPGRTAAIGRAAPAALPDAPLDAARRSRARVSLRLDDVRHRRLRLAAIHLDNSLQQILTLALDQYLAQIATDCPCMKRGCAAPDGAACRDTGPETGGAA